ncbi:MAG: hypothetical protein QXG97_00585 [Nitrososphaerota archaeon]
MCLADEFWNCKPCKKGYGGHWRSGVRDRVVVEGEVVRYLLWGSEIANWNRRENTLIADDCGWETRLTFDRLNGILGRVSMYVFSERGNLYFHDSQRNEDYVWEGSHMINLMNRRVTPCTPRKLNEKVSKALREYYEKARRLAEKRKFLVTVTLDGKVCVFVNSWYRRIERQVFGLHVSEDGFEAYKGMAATSKVYSAFTRNDATILMNHLVERGYRIEKAESVLSELRDFEVDFDVLPESVVSKLAIAKLLEE